MKQVKTYQTLLVFLAAVLLSLWAEAGSGGASVVGDGGYIVKCDRGFFKSPQIYFFDLYEFNTTQGEQPVTLGRNLSLKDKVQVGLDRISARFGLDSVQTETLKRAARLIYGLSYDPWLRRDVPSIWDLGVKSVLTDNAVGNRLAAERCELIAAVLRLTPENSGSIFRDVCQKGTVSEKLCLIKNTKAYDRLNNDDKACLIIHESLRYLPVEKALPSERALREVTGQICTQ